VREKIAQVAQSMLSLRAALRNHYVADPTAQIREFISQLEPVLLLLKCYTLQNAGSGIAEHVRKLQDLSGQLATSSFEHGDNVRCMDDLQYQILPVLNKLLKVFRK